MEKYLSDETFLLTYGDGISDININDKIKFHNGHKKIVTISAVRPPARFGSLSLDGPTVTNFKEKQQLGESWINGGFFVIEPSFFKYIELPMLVKIAPSIFTIIFLFCSLTFSIALVLGGGPSATTVELAIYQTIVFEGDLAAAARLSTFQLMLLTLLLILSTKFTGYIFIEQTIVLKIHYRMSHLQMNIR